MSSPRDLAIVLKIFPSKTLNMLYWKAEGVTEPSYFGESFRCRRAIKGLKSPSNSFSFASKESKQLSVSMSYSCVTPGSNFCEGSTFDLPCLVFSLGVGTACMDFVLYLSI